MCEIVSMFKIEPEVEDVKCNDHIDQAVYMNIVIVSVVCVLTSLIVPMFINRVGLRVFTGT